MSWLRVAGMSSLQPSCNNYISAVPDVRGSPVCTLHFNNVWHSGICDLVRRNCHRVVEKRRNTMGKKVKMEIHSGSFRTIQYSLVFTVYSGADAGKKLWLSVFCLIRLHFFFKKLRDKFAIFVIVCTM